MKLTLADWNDPDGDLQDWINLADEFNDAVRDDPICPLPPLELEDFDKRFVARAERAAKARGLAWPPSTGDLDRAYDWAHNEGRYR